MQHRWILVGHAARPLPVRCATTFRERAAGLFACPELGAEELLLLRPCRAIHTLGLGFAIDVAFADDCGRVLSIRAALAPWRCACEPLSATVWEARAGHFARHGIGAGVALRWC